jgi:hypothetical protein
MLTNVLIGALYDSSRWGSGDGLVQAFVKGGWPIGCAQLGLF